MKNELTQLIKSAILMYVKKQEGRKYQGDNTYNLSYIKNSKKIPEHRKRDIEQLHLIMKEEDNDPNADISLCFNIYTYLKTIKTGFKLFWLFQINTSSSMRDCIHNAMFMYNPALFEACKNGTVDQYKRFIEQMAEPCVEAPGEEDDALVKLYVQLKKDHHVLKGERDELIAESRGLKEKIVFLQDNLHQLRFANEVLKKKLDNKMKKNASLFKETTIEMTTFQNKAELNSKNTEHAPDQISLKKAAM